MVLHGLCLIIRHIWSTFTHEDMNGSRNIPVFTEIVSVDLGSILLKPIAVNVIIYKPQHPDDVSSIFYGVRCSGYTLGHCEGGGKKGLFVQKNCSDKKRSYAVAQIWTHLIWNKTRFQFNLVGSKLHRIE